MYILAGKYKGRRLLTPKSATTRPTLAKVRGSVFDILQNEVEGARFLDLFAGSGAMGIEALSRGAKSACFVEKDRRAASVIRKNLENLGLNERVFVLDVEKAVESLRKKGEKFDLIYVDPPYSLHLNTLLNEIADILAEDGRVLLEQGKSAEVETTKLELQDTRIFGDTKILFFSHCH